MWFQKDRRQICKTEELCRGKENSQEEMPRESKLDWKKGGKRCGEGKVEMKCWKRRETFEEEAARNNSSKEQRSDEETTKRKHCTSYRCKIIDSSYTMNIARVNAA